MTPQVRMAPGPALWRIVLGKYREDPVGAMKALRVAGASARQRAILALEAWSEPGPRLQALLTLRSASALRHAATKAGWLMEDRLEIPGASAEDLERLEALVRLRGDATD